MKEMKTNKTLEGSRS
jgi:hypothetical protein